MKQRLLSFIAMFLAMYYVQAQQDTDNIHFYELMKQRNITDPNEFIGKEYFFDTWLKATIKLKGSTQYTLDKVNLNLLTNSIDVLIRNELKEIPERFIKEIEFVAEKMTLIFSPTINFVKYGVKSTGFIEKIAGGSYQIFTHHFSTMQKPHPQAAILGLEKRAKLNQNKVNYILQGGKFKQVKSKKDLKDILKSKYNTAVKLIDEKSLDVSDGYDLALLLNSL